MRVYNTYMPFHCESNLAVTVPDRARQWEGDTVTPIEFLLRDKHYLKYMLENGLFFEIDDYDFEEIKEKNLIIYRESEKLFKIIKNEACQNRAE